MLRIDATVYYQATKSAPKLQEQLVEPVKAMIEENPSFGYCTVAHLLSMNKKGASQNLNLEKFASTKSMGNLSKPNESRDGLNCNHDHTTQRLQVRPLRPGRAQSQA
ncbi:hypothetical protein [Lampropedia aestuarii]|uniref:hypothetical protein n=1 Tax=Lampropedia aestuarii TaxID=2562762 RepID=UPI002468D19A|nr:hypothetical protein [Lampropedia aestuarii]MDH5859296.1 hypothetical protein [Lampropedia aestuarii]